MHLAKPLISIALLFATLALPAAAQDRSLNFALRGGLAATPAYPGSDELRIGPDLGFTFGALKWGGRQVGNGVGVIPESGLALSGAFRILGAREQADYGELAGLTDIDAAVELGLGLAFRQPNWEVYGEVRKGVTGHSGVTGTLGGDVIFRPDNRWTISAGPRISFGDREFASIYFGVSAPEAAASQFGAFDAGGGALGAGFEVEATYQFSDRWALEGAVAYEKLLNDAADSPITSLGSDDQWKIRLGLSRAFTLNF
jgi:outer membrane protein